MLSGMDSKSAIPRRDVLAAAATALTTSLFTGNIKGANDRIAVGFIGLGAMGSGNLGYSMKVPEVAARGGLRHLPAASGARAGGGSKGRSHRETGEGFPRDPGR